MLFEGSGTLKFRNILAGSGMLGRIEGASTYYYLKNHLGSVRTTVNTSGTVANYDDYYPFGLAMPGRTSNSSDPYKFTGHERDSEAGLTLDYMIARNHDPIIGRFLQTDPHHYNYLGVSPYTYVGNNPMVIIDPTGMELYLEVEDFIKVILKKRKLLEQPLFL